MGRAKDGEREGGRETYLGSESLNWRERMIREEKEKDKSESGKQLVPNGRARFNSTAKQYRTFAGIGSWDR